MPTGPFGLSENPFVEGHDARYVYSSRAHGEVVAHLRPGIENQEPFVLVTGLPGAGKTVAVQAVLAEAGPHALVSIAVPPSLSPAKLRERILSGFAPDAPAAATHSGPSAGIEARLRAIRADGRRMFLVVDEAQNLGLPLLEELRVLSDLESDGRSLLQIVLVGQPRLEDDLSRPGGDALRQRIAVRCRLGLLRPEETESYIRHRVSVAGGDSRSLFTSEGCESIHRLAHGIPREVNQLAGEALMLADAAGECAVTAGHVAAAVVLLGFRSVVGDSRPTTVAAKPVAVEAAEVAPPAGIDSGRGACEEAAAGDPVSAAVPLPVMCETPLAEAANESSPVDIGASVPEDPDEAPATSPPESPVVEIESDLPALSVVPGPVPTRPVGPAAKATPADIQNPEVGAWLARFRSPDGPPRIGSRLAVATTEFEALEPRTTEAADERCAVPAPPPRAGARARRRAAQGGHLSRTATSMAGALLLVAVGGVVLATSVRGLVRARPSTRAANEITVRSADRARTVSASVRGPSLASAPPTVAPTRPAARPASALLVAAAATRPDPAATRPIAQGASAPPGAAVATSASAPARPARRYGVEVAKFIVETRAVEERDRLAALISLPCRVTTSREDGAEIYSIVVGPVASPEEAVRLSEDLSTRRLVGEARVVRWVATDSTRR